MGDAKRGMLNGGWSSILPYSKSMLFPSHAITTAFKLYDNVERDVFDLFQILHFALHYNIHPGTHISNLLIHPFKRHQSVFHL